MTQEGTLAWGLLNIGHEFSTYISSLNQLQHSFLGMKTCLKKGKKFSSIKYSLSKEVTIPGKEG